MLKLNGSLGVQTTDKMGDELDEKPLTELRRFAKRKGLSGYAKLKKDELVEFIKNKLVVFPDVCLKDFEGVVEHDPHEFAFGCRKDQKLLDTLEETQDISAPYGFPLDTGVDVKVIYHLADIHIRTLVRHDEYKAVMRMFIKYLKRQDLNNAVVCIVGDLFHDKDKLKSEMLMLARWFLNKLGSMLPVIIIPGNHDLLESQPGRLDNITPVVDGLPVIYLRTSGVYEIEHINNLTFVVSSLVDHEFIHRCSVDSDRLVVSLFHGIINGCQLSKQFSGMPGFLDKPGPHQLRLRNLDDFDGFALTLLGDIHMPQCLPKQGFPLKDGATATSIAYPGSFIQQNYGEPTNGHGFLKWNLADNMCQFVEVENKVGMVDIQLVSDIWTNPEVEFPQNCFIRCSMTASSNEVATMLKTHVSSAVNVLEFKNRNIHPKVKPSELMPIEGGRDGEDGDDGEFDSDELLQRMHDLDINKLIHAEAGKRKLRRELIASLVDYHAKITSGVDERSGETSHKQLILHKLELKNMLGYGSKQNTINFHELEGVINIYGENAVGKSSIAIILCYTLYDHLPNNGSKLCIINNSAKSFWVKLAFTYGGVMYQIKKE